MDWDLPKPQEVSGTILAVDLFLGTVLGISQVKFNNSDEKFDGKFNVNRSGDGTGTVNLNLTSHPEELAAKKEGVLRVVEAPPEPKSKPKAKAKAKPRPKR